MKLLNAGAEISKFGGGIVVPTMGALHAGHAKLIERAVELRDERGWAVDGPRAVPVVVTIFVNPMQFNDPRDLERYPRTLDADCRVCEEAGADVVFAPSVEVVYPGDRGGAERGEVPVELPEVATRPGLEDAKRPGHFAGVCRVVRRLFEMTRARAAMFGEKDWQQLRVVMAMTAMARLGIEIVPVATLREAGGLAMSSRNVFLSPAERERALSISRALCDAAGERDWRAAEGVMRRVLEGAGLEIEYAVVRDAASLLPLGETAREGRALIAVRNGAVRLIDNADW